MKTPLLTISFLSSGRTKTLWKCLDSLSHLRESVDSELIIVDTGCDLETHNRMLEYTDKIVSFEWCNDFSKARNVGVDLAKGKWFLYLDDDEWFESTTEIENFLLSGEESHYGQLLYYQRNYTSYKGSVYNDALVSRMVRLGNDVRLQYSIHETFKNITGKAKIVHDYVHHYGYIYSSEKEKFIHSQRNIVPLVSEHKKDPYNLRHVAQLAQEYTGTKEYSKEQEICLEGIQYYYDGKAGKRYINSLFVALISSYMKQYRYEDAKKAGMKFLKEKELNILAEAKISALLGQICLELEEYDEALYYLECYKENYLKQKDMPDAYAPFVGLFLYDCFAEQNINKFLCLGVIAAIKCNNEIATEKFFSQLDFSQKTLSINTEMIQNIIEAFLNEENESDAIYFAMIETMLERYQLENTIASIARRVCEENREKAIAKQQWHKISSHGWYFKLLLLRQQNLKGISATEVSSKIDSNELFISLWCESPVILSESISLGIWNLFPDKTVSDLISQIPLYAWEKNVLTALHNTTQKKVYALDRILQNCSDESVLHNCYWNSQKTYWKLKHIGDEDTGLEDPDSEDMDSVEDKDIHPNTEEGSEEIKLPLSHVNDDIDVEQLFQTFCSNTITFYQQLYKTDIVQNTPDSLPELYQIAIKIDTVNKLLNGGNSLDAIRLLKDLLNINKDLGEAIKQYILSIQPAIGIVNENEEPVSPELIELGNKLKQSILTLGKQGQISKAKEILCQVKQYLPEDEDLFILEEVLNKNTETTNTNRDSAKDADDISSVHNCVGCMACMQVCPVNAITLKQDDRGFEYPDINRDLCIHCGKCTSICPTIHASGMSLPGNCFAIQADDELRKNASSGGLFPLFAQLFLANGGFVCGAVFDDNLHVKHIISNRIEDIQKMQTSKYVQSDLRGIYREAKSILEEGNLLFFTGTGCQIAGLHAFLQKDYENLYTMDVVCHGVPSPGIYAHYLKDLKRRYGQIEEINFRKKEALGWNTGMYIRTKKGEQYVEKGSPYIAAFLQNWILRDSCYNCQFKGKKYSDITVGDFWGIQKIDSDFEDGLGTSMLTINSLKGYELYDLIRNQIIKKKKFCHEDAIRFNPSIIKSVPMPKISNAFFQHLNSQDLKKAMTDTYQSIHFDIGLVLWWSTNFGNALTNYALYKVLSQKKNVLAIDNAYLFPGGSFADFARAHYNCSSDYFPYHSMQLLGNCCETYIIGSDQTWNTFLVRQMKCGLYYQLDFVNEKSRKISYGASFGMREAYPSEKEAVSLYQKFNKVSVREKFGVDVCREQYHIQAQHVMDPVFLLSASDYEQLASDSKAQHTKPYILGYLLNPTVDKRYACQEIQKQLGDVDIIYINESSSVYKEDRYHETLRSVIKGNIGLEDWLYYFCNASYVVTDSFHGTCLSIIMKKQFMAFINRQPDRFELFKDYGKAYKRIIHRWDRESMDVASEVLDYTDIERKLENDRKESMAWLEQALECDINHKVDRI